MAVAGVVVATSQVSSIELRASRRSVDDVRATALAEAGIEQAKALLVGAASRNASTDPMNGVRALFGGADEFRPFSGEPMLSGGATVGEYSTLVQIVTDTPQSVVVRIRSTGYVPAAPQNLGAGEPLQSWESLEVTVDLGLAPSEVFDSAYFINNWGWLYGSNIDINGNARSNGQMDFGGYAPAITGSPTFASLAWDGNRPELGPMTSEGGVFSSWDIVGAQRARGAAADANRRYEFQDPVEMPNLSDLSRYEALANASDASIRIGNRRVADAVVGDGPGEKDNLYLHGTRANPITLDGPVVVRGDVVISGYVTGQGCIYAGGNVYVPDSIEYRRGPSTGRPASDDQADIERWIRQNRDKDFLGLFSGENIVVGDFTNSTWRRNVGNWLASPLNSSREDAGADLIPNTAAGRDGILGTADDDVLEGDGIFTVETYTDEDAAAGLIPDGFRVGDVIPGSGEDIDGDGRFDDTLTLDDFEFRDPLERSHWEGNMPRSGIEDYRDIASLQAHHLDAVFYTNHAFAWLVLGGADAVINGAVVARNESIVYGTPRMVVNHDARLLGGASGIAGDLLPLTLRPMRVLQWRRLAVDPFQAAP